MLWQDAARRGSLRAALVLACHEWRTFRVDALQHALGKSAQIRQATEGTEKSYCYLADAVQVDFFVRLSKIYLITLRKAGRPAPRER